MIRIAVNWEPTPVGDGWEVAPDPVVWLSVEKLEASFSRGDQYVGPGGTVRGQRGRYEGIGRHIRSGFPIWMPDISLDHREEIRFADGRHRFAWVRDHGANSIPVTTGQAQAERVAQRFGSTLRVCSVTIAV